MIRLVVTYADHQTGYYDVPEGESWHVDAASRCLIVGRGVPRKMVPLDGVMVIDIEDTPRPPGPRPRRGLTRECRGCGLSIAWNGSRWVDDQGQADTAGFCSASTDPDPAHEPREV